MLYLTIISIAILVCKSHPNPLLTVNPSLVQHNDHLLRVALGVEDYRAGSFTSVLDQSLFPRPQRFKRRSTSSSSAVASRHHVQYPLYAASQYNHIEIVKLLLGAEGIEINQPTNNGATPLFVASQNGFDKIVKVLLGAEGIKINKSNIQGATPLLFASQYNHIEIVKLLLGAEGIEINQRTNDGATALAMAKQEKHKEIVQLLATAGATE